MRATAHGARRHYQKTGRHRLDRRGRLIDATAGGHLWAERYDGAIQDIFALQDKVTTKFVSSLAVKLTADEAARTARRETPSAQAHDAFLKRWAHYIQTTPEDYAKAVALLEKAIARDPNYGRALAMLASLYLSARVRRWNESLGMTPGRRAAPAQGKDSRP